MAVCCVVWLSACHCVVLCGVDVVCAWMCGMMVWMWDMSDPASMSCQHTFNCSDWSSFCYTRQMLSHVTSN